MKYLYIGRGSYYPGLPARDLDDTELSEAQQRQLTEALAIGLYERVPEVVVTSSARAKPSKSEKSDGE